MKTSPDVLGSTATTMSFIKDAFLNYISFEIIFKKMNADQLKGLSIIKQMHFKTPCN
jgi:hypothetical protein